MRPAWRPVLSLAGVLALTPACNDDGPGAAPTDVTPSSAIVTAPAGGGSAPVGETATVQSIDNTFRPERLEVAPGTAVVWTNNGRTAHDIESEFGFGVTAADFEPGDEYRFVFTDPGEYPYYCTIHGTATAGMVGTIVVTTGA